MTLYSRNTANSRVFFMCPRFYFQVQEALRWKLYIFVGQARIIISFADYSLCIGNVNLSARPFNSCIGRWSMEIIEIYWLDSTVAMYSPPKHNDIDTKGWIYFFFCGFKRCMIQDCIRQCSNKTLWTAYECNNSWKYCLSPSATPNILHSSLRMAQSYQNEYKLYLLLSYCSLRYIICSGLLRRTV